MFEPAVQTWIHMPKYWRFLQMRMRKWMDGIWLWNRFSVLHKNKWNLSTNWVIGNNISVFGQCILYVFIYIVSSLKEIFWITHSVWKFKYVWLSSCADNHPTSVKLAFIQTGCFMLDGSSWSWLQLLPAHLKCKILILCPLRFYNGLILLLLWTLPFINYRGTYWDFLIE